MNVSTSLRPLIEFLGRYHFTIFLSFIGLSLAVAFLLLYQVLEISGQPDTTSAQAATINSSFDQATIERINQLHPSDRPQALVFPSSRNNPFTE